MHRQRKAKIVATVGPSSAAPDVLENLFLAGVDVFRMNFSHGERADHIAVHRALRALERKHGRPIAVLQDLQGPKIRLGRIPGGERHLAFGDLVSFTAGETAGDRHIPLPHAEIFDAASAGHGLLIDDGRVRLRIEEVRGNVMTARALNCGTLRDRKGVNLPDSILAISPITEKDRRDLELGLDLGVDWVAMSFVQTAADITAARDLIGSRAALMAKIEKPTALAQISSIVAAADGIMVARGDLGVEIPCEEVPGWQKQIVQLCRVAMKPVIVATQMLESMVSSPTPTRAEASDVATAIYDGADAVMLSAESAVGDYPVESVEVMDRIIRKTETHRLYRSFVNAIDIGIDAIPSEVVSKSAADVADQLDHAVIAAFTYSGATAARIARWRPAAPIIALTPRDEIARRLNVLWGTHSVFSEDIASYEEMIARASATAEREGIAPEGTQLIIVGGIPFGEAGTTNNLRIARISRPVVRNGAPAYGAFEI
ncbi:pyruvate kinase [Bradyrhizobium sp.]|uniref:pyruvate kinase n=1 Tax=Bradyrhizobium sp. TaxID=376 RepID=UPI002637ACF3|nr:pyruvate kinase [Bradyrhizobium sp.]